LNRQLISDTINEKSSRGGLTWQEQDAAEVQAAEAAADGVPAAVSAGGVLREAADAPEGAEAALAVQADQAAVDQAAAEAAALQAVSPVHF